MKKRLPKKLSLNRETLRHLEAAALRRVDGGLTTTPIGTCPKSDPAVCAAVEGVGSSTLECTQ